MIDERDVEDAVKALAARASLGAVSAVERLAGGANNRAYRVRIARRTAFAKVYFQHRDDPRDRLGAEVGFARFAWAHGVRSVPEALAADPSRGIALFAFVEGRKLAPHEIDPARLEEALRFVTRLNRHRGAPDAAALPAASEACFSLEEHLRHVDRRVWRLVGMRVDDAVDASARRFLDEELLPGWKSAAATARAAAADLPVAANAPLPQEHRCLSPSDFGFHNALLREDGQLVFHDFEYAGWDDAAKLVRDFFCQPALRVPRELRHGFVEGLVRALRLPEWHRGRVALLEPVYDILWCCILMNDFLPVGGERRRFARGDGGRERKRRQLEKARERLAELAEREVL